MNHEILHSRSAAHCRLADFRKALGMFTGRWKLEILWLLCRRSYHVAELRRAVPNITQPVLTAKLRELEADGLVRRRISEEIPQRVEYELTLGARRFGTFVRAIMRWPRQKVLAQELERSSSAVHRGSAP